MAQILAIDLGSTQMKLMCLNENAQIISNVTARYPTYTPKASYMQQNPEDWLKAMKVGLTELAEKVNLEMLDVISFSGHMSSVILVDQDNKPLYPCIMLADSRSEKQAMCLQKEVGERIRKNIGNPVINAFSLPKLVWLKEKEPELFNKTKLWINAKDYLRFYLCGQLATEYTDAYNSLCLDPHTTEWNQQIVEESGLPFCIFPEVHAPSEIAGYVTREAADEYGFREGTPVAFGAADMACGAVGNHLFELGDSTLTLGTCATFLSMVDEPKQNAYGMVTFHMHALKDKLYALGSHFNGGLAVNTCTKWLSESEKIDFDLIAKLSEEAERVKPGAGGVMTIPFLAGSGSPYFDSQDRQNVLFMNASTTRAELFRSELEGITYNLKETQEIFSKFYSDRIDANQSIVLGGGGVKVGIWPQMIADVFNRPIDLAENADASTIGAGIIGGKAIGVIDNMEQVSGEVLKVKNRIEPQKDIAEAYATLYRKYLRTYNLLKVLREEEKKE